MIPKVVPYQAYRDIKNAHQLYHGAQRTLERFLPEEGNANNRLITGQWAIIGGTKSIIEVCSRYNFEFGYTGERPQGFGTGGVRTEIFREKHILSDNLTVVLIYNHINGGPRISTQTLARQITMFVEKGKNPIFFPAMITASANI